LEKEILRTRKGKFWQFEKENFDSLEKEILRTRKGKFWQFEKENFDSLKREILIVWKKKILIVWKGNFPNSLTQKKLINYWLKTNQILKAISNLYIIFMYFSTRQANRLNIFISYSNATNIWNLLWRKLFCLSSNKIISNLYPIFIKIIINKMKIDEYT
jgi:hypothetical protein